MISTTTTKTGETVAVGTPAEVTVGAMVWDGHAYQAVASLGRPFSTRSGERVYGYFRAAAAGSPKTATRTRRQRSCVTGGDCSSFGTGRSCGGYDCDGH